MWDLTISHFFFSFTLSGIRDIKKTLKHRYCKIDFGQHRPSPEFLYQSAQAQTLRIKNKFWTKSDWMSSSAALPEIWSEPNIHWPMGLPAFYSQAQTTWEEKEGLFSVVSSTSEVEEKVGRRWEQRIKDGGWIYYNILESSGESCNIKKVCEFHLFK